MLLVFQEKSFLYPACLLFMYSLLNGFLAHWQVFNRYQKGGIFKDAKLPQVLQNQTSKKGLNLLSSLWELHSSKTGCCGLRKALCPQDKVPASSLNVWEKISAMP